MGTPEQRAPYMQPFTGVPRTRLRPAPIGQDTTGALPPEPASTPYVWPGPFTGKGFNPVDATQPASGATSYGLGTGSAGYGSGSRPAAIAATGTAAAATTPSWSSWLSSYLGGR
jgi:hypothetical protein